MCNRFKFIPLLILFLAMTVNHSFAQRSGRGSNVYVDKKGIMRWGKSNAEVHGFGINYTVPFAHAYRSAKKLNISHKEAIDDDVYHFARLGFDAYRVHVWDTEISDSLGNLLENDHLQLFDYMLKKMKERGMKFILTPIAFWGNGWPEPDEKTPGFSRKYGKENCLTDEDAIKAQERYLFQFLNHVNPHTGLAYKDDPDIIAFEISNEPHHNESPDKVTAYITRLVSSMRKTKCAKPIFYNISHSIHLVNAYFNAPIQGGTFQWYPTGLGAQEELGGNLLPNVDRYTVTFGDNPKYKKAAKVVYEFDAADVGRSYIYPAMARSFRQAGIQWAAHFSYDPTYMAYGNTEYNTHYMNLVYTPQKALSLKLASEVFHRVPLYEDYGSYPGNAKFDAFRVSYEEDLAEMITDKKFIYTNNTKSNPTSLDNLEEVAGFANSSVVSYEGAGAYFLDKIESGVWRLEVMPDAIWIQDPFGRNSLMRQVAVVNWRTWPMSINLPDLGNGFSVRAINDNNTFSTTVDGNSFKISPGTYLLTRGGVQATIEDDAVWKNIIVKEFFAPPSNVMATEVVHTPAGEIREGSDYTVDAMIVSKEAPQSVTVSLSAGFRPKVYEMKKLSGYRYGVTIPQEEIKEGFLRYFITVSGDDKKATSFPSGEEGSPSAWDFSNRGPFEVRILKATSPLYIFDAAKDNDELSRVWNNESSFVPKAEPGKAEIRVKISNLFKADPENPKAPAINDYSMRFYFGKKIAFNIKSVEDKKDIVFRGRSLTEKPCWVQVALITKDGEAFGGIIKVDAESMDYKLSLSALRKVKVVNLPRPYPTFLPYFFEDKRSGTMDIMSAEVLQISIGPGIPEDQVNDSHGVAIESVRLE
ncbi:MAG TPA: membrane or secreted protein [Chryseolinea sp.]|nr:membrane or secreted protein [Chryseolinea sp.]